MKEFRVHCLFFTGEFCHPGCANYEITKGYILKTAEKLGKDPDGLLYG